MPNSIDRRWLAFVMPALALATLNAQRTMPDLEPAAARAEPVLDKVLHDDAGGVHWAVGRDWKASFDRGGFTFIPCFGARAPRNFPVAFHVVALRVGGSDVAFASDVAPRVHGDRVLFDRGALREVYDTAAAHVAQSFVVDSAHPGDVEIELRVTSDLREHGEHAGLQFANEHGAVEYGDAFLVRDGERLPIATTFVGGSLRLRVPGELRGNGPVVIDPIINTVVADYLFSLTFTTNFPDIAFEASTARYLAVWERTFSASDRDVLSQFFDNDGNVVPSLDAAIDISGIDCRVPRVASVASPSRFLVVYERQDPAQWNGRSMIFGRIRQADGLTPLQPEIMISHPIWPGSNSTPDVGGDPWTLQTTSWAIVWTHTSGSDSTIHRRSMRGDAVMIAQDDVLASESGHALFSPQISQGNGNGHSANPGWLVVYSRIKTPTDIDVGGTFLSVALHASPPILLDYGSTQDLFAFVSSPATNANGALARYLVTYERQAPLSAQALVYEATTNTFSSPTDLTASFGIGPHWTRGDSDRTRFVVAASAGTNANAVALSTLAFDGQAFVVHEANVPLPGSVTFPQVVANRAMGGAPNHYAVIYQDATTTPARTTVTKHLGHAPGNQIVRRPFACDGLGCDATGTTALGGAVSFTLGNVGTAFPGFAIGLPSSTPIPVCATCSVGLRLDQPSALAFGSVDFDLLIPSNIALVGASLTVQGLSVGQGSCVGSLSFSDAFDVTLR